MEGEVEAFFEQSDTHGFDHRVFTRTIEQIRKTLLQPRSGTPPDELQHYLRQKAIQWEGVTDLLAYCDARNCFSGEYVSFNVSVDIAERTNQLARTG